MRGDGSVAEVRMSDLVRRGLLADSQDSLPAGEVAVQRAKQLNGSLVRSMRRVVDTIPGANGELTATIADPADANRWHPAACESALLQGLEADQGVSSDAVCGALPGVVNGVEPSRPWLNGIEYVNGAGRSRDTTLASGELSEPQLMNGLRSGHGNEAGDHLGDHLHMALSALEPAHVGIEEEVDVEGGRVVRMFPPLASAAENATWDGESYADWRQSAAPAGLSEREARQYRQVRTSPAQQPTAQRRRAATHSSP